MTEWQKYTAMAARLGSIAPSKMNALPISVQKILEEDMVFCLAVVKAVVEFRDDYANAVTDITGIECAAEFHEKMNGLGL